jgi:hypothetical protein
MRLANLAAAAVLLGVGAFFIWGATKLPIGRLNSPDAGFAPYWEGIFLGLGALILMAASLCQKSMEPVEWPRGNARRMIIHLAVALVGYVLLVGLVGYISSTFLFMLVAISAWRRYSWWVVGFSAAGLSLSLYLVFSILLQTSLPRNLLGLP